MPDPLDLFMLIRCTGIPAIIIISIIVDRIACGALHIMHLIVVIIFYLTSMWSKLCMPHAHQNSEIILNWCFGFGCFLSEWIDAGSIMVITKFRFGETTIVYRPMEWNRVCVPFHHPVYLHNMYTIHADGSRPYKKKYGNFHPFGRCIRLWKTSQIYVVDASNWRDCTYSSLWHTHSQGLSIFFFFRTKVCKSKFSSQCIIKTVKENLFWSFPL